MKRAIATIMFAAACLAAASASTQPASLNAREVMERNFLATKVASLRVESTMSLITGRGQQRQRANTGLIKLQPNGVDSKIVVTFSTPPDIKGTAVLQVEHSDGDDDMWIYLPALKKSRRLVANNKKDSFAGSDFSYGDITLPKVDLYRHTQVRAEQLDGVECFVIESVPANDVVKANSGYSKKVSWIRPDNFIEAKVEYYDVSGRLLKTQRTSKHKLIEPDKGRWFALYREMTNHQTGHRTTIDFVRAESVAIGDDTFTTRYLERQ